MFRLLPILFFWLCVDLAHAQGCPDFYRFVDFGLVGNDGKTYRGGTTFRAEDFNGDALLIEEKTTCLPVSDIAKDGHGNPIPVVSSINYDPEKTGEDFDELQVSAVPDTGALATNNATSHQKRLGQDGVKITRGSDFLCASETVSKTLSCQLVSPYPGNIPLVVYCEFKTCTMPVLAINPMLHVSAQWSIENSLLLNPQSAGSKFARKVKQVHDFLKPLSADL